MEYWNILCRTLVCYVINNCTEKLKKIQLRVVINLRYIREIVRDNHGNLDKKIKKFKKLKLL